MKLKTHRVCALAGLLAVSAVDMSAVEFYVAPTGSDTNSGTMTHPFQTVSRAQTAVRAVNAGMTGDITVYLRGGRYEISSTLSFTSADSGDKGFHVIYRSYPGESATISGGKQVEGWSPVSGKAYWTAPVPTADGFADYFRQLYVNGIRADRARSDWITSVSYFDDPATGNRSCDGIAFNAADMKNYSNISDLRLMQITYFKIDEFPVTGITTNSTNGLVQVALQQPYCQQRYNYGTNFFRATGRWMFIQAIEELDEPGEWYLNRATQKVYYYPYSYEDMTTAVVYAPVVETLVSLTGTSTANKVHDIRFEGLVFEHGNWFFPCDYIIGGTQSEILFRGVPPTTAGVGYSYEMPGQILLNNTLRIEFLGNTLRHLGSCGIHPFNGARDTLIQGNVFNDLTGAAVIGGRWQQDPAIPNQEICTNTVIADNVIRNIGMDFMAATAVNNLQHYGWQVIRNDIADTAYMGVHQRNYVGKLPAGGLGGTVVSSNRISMANTAGRYGSSDCGGIYSFGVWPNSIAQANDVSDVNQPSAISPNVSGLYQDNNSYGWTWKNNVVRDIFPGMIGCKWVRYDTNDPNVNVAIGNFTDATVNWTMALASNINFATFTPGSPPAAAQAIIKAAGVGPAYTDLMARIYSSTNLAKEKTAWASSQWDAGMPPSAAVDWDYGSKWHPKSGDTNAWWAVDLGAPYVIQRIEIAARTDMDQSEARRNFQVQAANNTNFTGFVVLAEQGTTPFAYKAINLANSWIKFVNNPQAFRYLRVKATRIVPLNFSEFKVHGYPAGSSPEQLLWDAGATGGQTDGGGKWLAPNQWWNGSDNQSWADNSDVIIGNQNGTGGTIVVSGNPQIRALTFNPPTTGRYVITGNPIVFVGSGTITVTADAGIDCPLVSTDNLYKDGPGILTLGALNQLGDVVRINDGALLLTNRGALAKAPRTQVAGASSTACLRLGGGQTFTNTPLEIEGKPTISAGPVLVNTSGANIWPGALTLTWGGPYYAISSDAGKLTITGDVNPTSALTGTRWVVLDGAADGEIKGVITNGALATIALQKNGAGTWTLSGSNTYSGATVLSNGTLLVTGRLGGSGAVTVGSAGKLGGTGVITGLVTVAGTLAPGASPGTLTISNNLLLAASASLAFELGTKSDRVAVSGNLRLDGTLNVSDAGGFGEGIYVLFTYGGTLTDNGLAIGTVPNAGWTYLVDTRTAGQVRLIAAATAFAAWQYWHFGGTGKPDAAAAADPDGDGMDNDQEFSAGTVPTNAASALRLTAIHAGQGVSVAWQCATGRVYQVKYTDKLPGEWLTNLPGSVLTPSPGDTNLYYTDTSFGAATNRFYRIRLLP